MPQDTRIKYEEKLKEMAFILYTEGGGFRRIARILSKIFNRKVYYQTVVKWLTKRHGELKIEEKIEETGAEIIELDELYATLKKPKRGGKWLKIWTAVDRNRMRMCSFRLGRGDLHDAIDIFEDIFRQNSNKIKHIYICTDGNLSYAANMKYFGTIFWYNLRRKTSCNQE